MKQSLETVRSSAISIPARETASKQAPPSLPVIIGATIIQGNARAELVVLYGTNSADPTTYWSLTQVTDVASGLTKFSYDSNHYLLTMTDPTTGSPPTTTTRPPIRSRARTNP